VTSAHLIFIPGVLIVGIAIGFVLGARAAKDAYNLELRRQKEREEAKRRREERRAARQQDPAEGEKAAS
jgi:uncharacterized membrane-anchored protein YhcB (DUF1043 family)